MTQKVFSKRAAMLAVLCAAFAMVLIGCDGTNSPADGGGHHGGSVITWEVFAVGWPTTEAFHFVFASDPGHLEPRYFNIRNFNLGGWATPESVQSPVPNVRIVTISSVRSGPTSVSIFAPWGNIDPTSREVMLYRDDDPGTGYRDDDPGTGYRDDDPGTGGLPGDSIINWTIRTQGWNGATNQLIFEFTSDPGSLQATDITLTSIAPAIVLRNQLSGFGTTRTLDITTLAPGDISVSINFGNINRESRTVRVENIWAR